MCLAEHHCSRVWWWRALVWEEVCTSSDLRPHVGHIWESKHTQVHSRTHSYMHMLGRATVHQTHTHTHTHWWKTKRARHVACETPTPTHAHTHTRIKTNNMLTPLTNNLYVPHTLRLNPFISTHTFPLSGPGTCKHIVPFHPRKCGDHYHRMRMWAVINKTDQNLKCLCGVL